MAGQGHAHFWSRVHKNGKRNTVEMVRDDACTYKTNSGKHHGTSAKQLASAYLEMTPNLLIGELERAAHSSKMYFVSAKSILNWKCIRLEMEKSIEISI